MHTKTRRKTEAEIDTEIAALEAERPNVRHFTVFTEDNRAAIDAQIKVLRQRMTADDLYAAFGDPADGMDDDDTIDDDAPFDQHMLDHALQAFEWMTGENEEAAHAPSVGWKEVR